MGRLCGGAHEILGIKAPLFLRGGWLEGSWGGWVGGGRVGVSGVGHGVGGWVVVAWVMEWVVVLWVPMTAPIMGHRMPPMLFFDNLVKK